ncbi:TerC family protein [Aneurinibacillus tyrosinisolvens]|jgi:YjbE family integral membrane protein|uniref:TerC family protein n=1 Tax=Aneurinibacillus tyrosinisolvens TaxID=1443435 RepID=UPI00063FD1E6|nr:TerC family protein [Aneurinibacillus tyrosinisolvens]
MEFFSAEFFSALLSIIIIDLVLAGDNAIVIGLAARNLPQDKQKRAIIWGTVGAIAIRAIATVFVVWLLKIPGLLFIGGVVLTWIAYKLLISEENEGNIQSSSSLIGAIRTIIVADVMMGLDNVLAVAGAADGHFALVVLGLLISVPLVVWGSQMILKLMDKFPSLIYIGAGVLALTAGKMLLSEKVIAPFFEQYPLLKWGAIGIIVAGVLIAGRMKKTKRSTTAASV